MGDIVAEISDLEEEGLQSVSSPLSPSTEYLRPKVSS